MKTRSTADEHSCQVHTLTGLKVLSTTQRLGTQLIESCGGGSSVVVTTIPSATNAELGGTGRQTYSALSPDACTYAQHIPYHTAQFHTDARHG